MTLTSDPAARKAAPVATGVLDYFPDALVEVARVSRAGNDQHNPGQPLHWAKEKSSDEADALVRHLLERGTIDTDGMRHSAKVAWRALALLQREIDAERADDTSVKEDSFDPYSFTGTPEEAIGEILRWQEAEQRQDEFKQVLDKVMRVPREPLVASRPESLGAMVADGMMMEEDCS